MKWQPPAYDDPWARRDEHGRTDARYPLQTEDDTRQIGPQSASHPAAYDGSLAQQADSAATRSPEIEARAYFLTVDGGVLAEIPCRENAGSLMIGRGQAADVRIDDPYVHRQQAEIHWDDAASAHIITHAGGQNGTWVNRQRIDQPTRLTGGESLRFGKTRLFYRIRR